jgi:hypothetical protein
LFVIVTGSVRNRTSHDVLAFINFDLHFSVKKLLRIYWVLLNGMDIKANCGANMFPIGFKFMQ